MASISSKFSSQSPQSPAPSSLASSTTPQTKAAQASVTPAVVSDGTSANTTPPKSSQKEEVEELEPYVPQKPKEMNTSFFSSLTRRLSSNSQTPGGRKVVSNGGMCPRRVMNIDSNRERCLLPELDQAKLRRVSFCVDVEIAGGPRYKEEQDDGEKRRKNKDKKLKEKGEGEALKHPQAATEEKEREGVVRATGENVTDQDLPCPEENIEEEKKDSSKKKEKKQRSEAERKERKEKKRRKAEENGSVPLEFTRESDEGSSQAPTPAGASPPKAQDKPTTDPVRIYRRCCQLRETPILKRITEQLTAPVSFALAEPGVVGCLDLTGSRLQQADFVTLSDWLAIVPVKKLLLEDADLTDECLRVVLAGLLAAKAPERSKRPGRSVNGTVPKASERSGVVEKVTLKNNPKVTRDGWKHISLFLYMCRSLKAMDVSMIPFPQTLPPSGASTTSATPTRTADSKANPLDAAEIFFKALSERLGGSHLEELMMAECGLSAQQVRKVVDGAIICGITRLGLAGNHLDDEGLQHVVHYIQSGVCHGLDLGGNDLRGKLGMLADALHEKSPFWAVSLASCNLDAASLKPLLPALTLLENFRFIDLSHNRDLFSETPSALALLRSYIPQLKALRRLHLKDVAMSPKQAIALAEVLPEGPSLGHLNLLENPQLAALTSATDESGQEEACALYASLMAATRVSNSIVCIDIEVPNANNSEVVKALAKQVVAYCLRNMERWTLRETVQAADAAAALAEPHGGEKQVTVPDVLLHLVGHVEDDPEVHDEDDPAPDEDYIVGGTGVVRALQYCLGEKASDLGRGSRNASGSATPTRIKDPELGRAKAKDMSKNLLGSARKTRARLQPAILREVRAGDELALRRLVFLDQTLQGMIERFEDEYPECRLAAPAPSQPTADALDFSDTGSVSALSRSSSPSIDGVASSIGTLGSATDATSLAADDDADEEARPNVHRHSSDVSLASRALGLEEAQMHRFGARVRREILPPQTLDYLHGTTGKEPPEPQHLSALREKLEALGGEEIRDKIAQDGWEATVEKIGANAEELRGLARQNPEEFKAFRESQLAAQANMRISEGEKAEE
ncbi:hypothetical protein BJ546DRAFT_432531 [Cryomyces antarcticus]